MSAETPPERGKAAAGSTRKKQPSRKLNLQSRVRGSFRRELDRLLDLDAIWSGLFVLTVLVSLGGPWFGHPTEPNEQSGETSFCLHLMSVYGQSSPPQQRTQTRYGYYRICR